MLIVERVKTFDWPNTDSLLKEL